LISFVRFSTLLFFLLLPPPAGIKEALTASPRKTMLERAKTFDLFASQDDGGEYTAVAVFCNNNGNR
jgi:hypothetical protein